MEGICWGNGKQCNNDVRWKCHLCQKWDTRREAQSDSRSQEPIDSLLNCENTGITHLIHIELALPSSQLSVACRKIPNEVVAGKRNERRETTVNKKTNIR